MMESAGSSFNIGGNNVNAAGGGGGIHSNGKLSFNGNNIIFQQ